MELLLHGGAGSRPEEPDRREAVLDEAASVGARASNPLAAVCHSVAVLEADPRFNAGVGSAVQSDGVIRTDGGVMTSSETVGAAAAMPGIEHAAAVARIVAEETPHVLVAGRKAVELAAAFDIPTDVDLWSHRTRKRWEELSPPGTETRKQLQWVRERFGGTDTVGAVGTDGETLAAVTSTGGRWCALAGRVGDVPQVGAGFYASPAAAASATGAGEAIARYGLARKVVETIERGDDPETATADVIRGFETDTGQEAGVIAIDADGRTGAADNAELMQTAET